MTDSHDSISDPRRQWEQGPLAAALARHPERRESFTTGTGIPVDRLYTPATTPDDYLARLGFPGQFPFTRGVQATMYRGRPWTVRQYAGFGSAEETNRRFHYLLEQGNTGVSVAFDLPTQIGYDSDDAMATGEIGRVGVAIDTVDDLQRLFDGIPLEKISTSMTINATAAILLAMYVVVGEGQGVDPAHLRGTIQNDILKEYAARGTYRFPPRPSLRLTRDIFAYCTEHLPMFNTISVSGYHMREAGCTAAQEIGFTLAHAIAYIETALASGLAIDDFAPRLAFFFAAHNDLFEEAAKFRAARRLYARIMRDRFGAKLDRSCMMRFHTQTGGVTLTAQQPETNIARVTMQALAAILGGTQSLHTNAKDEALALPTEDAVATAINTQHVLAHESGVANTIDPLGGSYFVEALTDQLEAEAEAIIAEIDALGGAAVALEKGWTQGRIEHAAYEFGRSVESGERIIVGINKYQSDVAPSIDQFRVADDVATRQREHLQRDRAERDSGRVESSLIKIAETARGDDNLMPPLLEAVRARATIGEICRALSSVFGDHDASR